MSSMLKRLAFLASFAAAIALSVVGTSYAQSLSVSAKELIGVYTGKWSSMNPGAPQVMPSDLTIESIADDGTTSGQFSWGAAPEWGVAPGSFPYKKGELSANTLIIGKGQKIEFRFTIQTNDQIQGGRWVDGVQTGQVVLTKKSAKTASVQ